MMMLAETEIPDIHKKKDGAAFVAFAGSLREATTLRNGNILTRAMVSCYVNDRVYRYMATICLVNHGYYAGTIRVHDDEEGFVEENFFLNDSAAIYSAGRSANVIVVENRASKNGMTRIEFEHV